MPQWASPASSAAGSSAISTSGRSAFASTIATARPNAAGSPESFATATPFSRRSWPTRVSLKSRTSWTTPVIVASSQVSETRKRMAGWW